MFGDRGDQPFLPDPKALPACRGFPAATEPCAGLGPEPFIPDHLRRGSGPRGPRRPCRPHRCAADHRVAVHHPVQPGDEGLFLLLGEVPDLRRQPEYGDVGKGPLCAGRVSGHCRTAVDPQPRDNARHKPRGERLMQALVAHDRGDLPQSAVARRRSELSAHRS